MFSLIITIISIALVAALALATLYYGGAAFNKGSADAEASKIVLQGQQLLGATELYFAEKNQWPTMQELLDGNYLKSVPQAGLVAVAPANAATTPWDMPTDRVPLFTLTGNIGQEVCAAVNLKGSLRQRGILRHAYPQLNAQCFGEVGSHIVVFKKFGELDSLDQAELPPGAVLTDPVPTDPEHPDWSLRPDAVVGGGGGGGGGADPAIDPPVTGDYECFVDPLDTSGRTASNGRFEWIWWEGDFAEAEFTNATVTIGGVPTIQWMAYSEDGYAETMAVPTSALTPGTRNVVVTGATGKTATCTTTVVSGGEPVQGQLFWQAAEVAHGTFPADHNGIISRAYSFINAGSGPVNYSNFRHNAPEGWTINPAPGWGQDCGTSGTMAAGAQCAVHVSWSSTTSVRGPQNWSMSFDTSLGYTATQRHSLTLESSVSLSSNTVTMTALGGQWKGSYEPVVTNNGASPVSLSSFVPANTQAFYTDLGNCGSSLAAGASCSLYVEFAPNDVNAYSTQALLTTSAGNFTVQLQGDGICIGGDSNWNASEGTCATPQTMNINLAESACYDELYKSSTGAGMTTNYARMILKIDSGNNWLADLRAARGNYTIEKIGGPDRGPFAYRNGTTEDFSNQLWWDGENYEGAQAMVLHTGQNAVHFESYSNTSNRHGSYIGDSPSDAMRFTFVDPQGRYPDTTLVAYCDFSPAAITHVEDNSFLTRTWGKARVYSITGGYTY